MADSPGGVEVGRASVRVVPDTSKFAAELAKQLAKLGDITVKLKIDADKRSIQAQVEKYLNAVQDVVSKKNLHLDFSVDTSEAVRTARKVSEQAQAVVDDVKIGFTVSKEGLVTDVREAVAQAEAAADSANPTVTVDADVSHLAAQIFGAVKAIEAGTKVDVPVRFTVDETGMVSDVRASTALAKTVASETDIVLHVGADYDGLAAAVRSAADEISDEEVIDLPVEMSIDEQLRKNLAREVQKLRTQLATDIPLGVNGDTLRAEASRLIDEAAANLKVPIDLEGPDAAKVRTELGTARDTIKKMSDDLTASLNFKVDKDRAEALVAKTLEEVGESTSFEPKIVLDKNWRKTLIAATEDSQPAVQDLVQKLFGEREVKIKVARELQPGVQELLDLVKGKTRAVLNLDAKMSKDWKSATLAEVDSISQKLNMAVPMTPEWADFQHDVTAWITDQRGKFNMDITPDMSDTDKASFKAEAESFTSDVRKLYTKAQEGLDFTESLKNDTKEMGKLGKETKKSSRLIAALTSGMGKLRKGAADPLRWELQNLHRAFGNLAPVLLGLGATFNALLPLVLSLGRELTAVAAGAAALGPAALSSAVVGVGVLTAGLWGFSDALEAVASGDDDKISEAMGNLAPNAKKAVKALSSLGSEYLKVRKQIQNALFEGVAKELETVGTKLLPTVRKGAVGVADSFNDMVSQGLKVAGSAKSIGNLQTVFTNTRKAITDTIPGAKALTVAFFSLSAAGSKYLPEMATYVSDLSVRFSDFIKESVKTGTFDAWVQRASAGFFDLLSVITGIIGVFDALSRAAAAVDSSPIRTVAEGVNSVADALNSADMQAGLTSFWQGIADVASAIMVALPGVSSLASTLANGVGQALSALAPSLSTFADEFNQLIDAMGPGLEAGLDVMIDAMDKLADVVKQQPVLFSALAGVILIVASPIAAVVAGIVALVWAFGELQKAWQAGAFDSIIEQLSPVTTAFQGLWTSLQALGVQIAAMFASMGETIQKWAPDFMQTVVSLGTSLGEGLTAVIDILGVLVEAFTMAWDAGLGDTVMTMITGAMDIIGGLFQALVGILQVVAGALSGDWSQLWTGLQNVAEGIWNALKGAFKTVLASMGGNAKSWGKSIKDTFGSIDLVQIGKDILQGLWDGMKSMWSSVSTWTTNQANKLKNIWNNVMQIGSPSKVMRKIGEWMMKGLYNGLTGSDADDVLQAARTLASKLADAVDSEDLSKATKNAALKYLRGHTAALKAIAKERTKVAAKLETAQKALQTAQDNMDSYMESVSDSVLSRYSISSSSATTLTGLTSYLEDAIEEQAKYNKLLAQLKKLGLNNTSYEELVGMDPSEGTSLAESILAGGKAAVKEVNSLESQLTAQADSLGTAASKTLYQAGVDAAQGLVDGLKAKTKALESAAETMANTIVKKLKKKLGIHSPSKVIASEVGSEIPAGAAMGIVKNRNVVDKALGSMVDTSIVAGLGSSSAPGVSIGTMVVADPDVAARAIAARQREVAIRYQLSKVV